MFREIQRLRDVEAMKNKESIDQCDRIKALDFDLQKTMIRIAETEKVVESRSYDIRNKSVALEDSEREIARVKDLNAQQNIECVALRKDVDRVSQDCYDLRKNCEDTEARNVDLGGNIRANDIHIKEKEDNLNACRKDIEGQAYTNNNMRADLADFSQEKEAMERHSRILLGQNDDLTKELERFVNTDEVLRQQLDRRGRVVVMQDRNNNEIGQSTSKIYEARQRSPLRDSRKYSPSPIGQVTRTTMATSGAYKPGNGSPLRSSYKPTYGKY
jgi:chromosome segregation ATPase